MHLKEVFPSKITWKHKLRTISERSPGLKYPQEGAYLKFSHATWGNKFGRQLIDCLGIVPHFSRAKIRDITDKTVDRLPENSSPPFHVSENWINLTEKWQHCLGKFPTLFWQGKGRFTFPKEELTINSTCTVDYTNVHAGNGNDCLEYSLTHD